MDVAFNVFFWSCVVFFLLAITFPWGLIVALILGIIFAAIYAVVWIDELKNPERTEKEKKELQEFKAEKRKFNLTNKYGESYVSSEIGRVLWVRDNRWMAFNANQIISYQPIERKHNEMTHNGLTRAVVGGAIAGPAGAVIGAGTGYKSGDVFEKISVIFQTIDGSRYEILEFEGSESARKIDWVLQKHNRLIREFDQIVNGKIN